MSSPFRAAKAGICRNFSIFATVADCLPRQFPCTIPWYQGIGIERGFRELGVWSKPAGAPFLCIEPWRGYASPKDFDGEFSDKPGLMHIAAGADEELSYRIEIGLS
jgi:hypothetical protein